MTVRPGRLPKIVVLRRRRDYLEKEIACAGEGFAGAWDKAEKAALDWAIEQLEHVNERAG